MKVAFHFLCFSSAFFFFFTFETRQGFSPSQNDDQRKRHRAVGAEKIMTQELCFIKIKENTLSRSEITLEMSSLFPTILFLLYTQLSLRCYFDSNDLVLFHGCQGLYH